MITIPVAVNIPTFKWQANLWWWNHQQTYGVDSINKACLIIIDKNFLHEKSLDTEWYKHIPHNEVTGVWNNIVPQSPSHLSMPLNIQVGLKQILDRFKDDDILEVTDCDLFHFRPHPTIDLAENTMYVCDLYEKWHMFTLTKNKHVIEPYFENNGQYYNGGFVPIIAHTKTFKKIIYEWEAVHRHILTRGLPNDIKWWAGMFALQSACEKAKIQMIAKDWCFIPPVNRLNDSHYTYHYSVDKNFDKKNYPNVNIDKLSDNDCYLRIKEWIKLTKI